MSHAFVLLNEINNAITDDDDCIRIVVLLNRDDSNEDCPTRITTTVRYIQVDTMIVVWIYSRVTALSACNYSHSSLG